MEAGTIVEWRVQPGDTVHRGDVVAVVDTDKSDIEVEVFEDGVIEELLVEEGRSVAVGTPLARIASRTDGAGTRATPGRSSPYARRVAAEHDIDLTGVTGSGPDGAVVAADLMGTAPRPPVRKAPPPVPARRSGRSSREAVAALMARSAREIPHYYLATAVDLGRATSWLTERNAARPVAERLLPAALFVKAAALAARKVPTLNGTWIDGFQPSPDVHVGMAISLRGGGLVAPAVRNADQLGIDELMAALRDLVARARAGRLRSSEMSSPTITVTSLGDEGADEVFGVIYPPQVALVGFGRVAERPWAEHGMVGARPTVQVTLAADHRASEGHEGSRFLATIDKLLREPEGL
jgi:pyruvate dehydrogenase E2 component (dihydrolipoamide acetyltransferase)